MRARAARSSAASTGVQRHYPRTAGRIENPQIGPFPAHASPRGRAPIDRELHLPRSWTEDRQRCRAVGIGDDVQFATKTLQARAMIARALDAGVPFAWVTADEVYGQNTELRLWLEQEVAHVLSCKSSQTVITAEATWRRTAQMIAELPARAWRTHSTGAGAHGERISEWARLPVRIAWRAGRGHWLLTRRSISTGELAYYLCYGPRGTSLAQLARTAGSRWRIEERSQQAEDEAGLDQYQVRDYRAWYAHIPPQAGGAPVIGAPAALVDVAGGTLGTGGRVRAQPGADVHGQHQPPALAARQR